MQRHHHPPGFSLVESLVALAIATILVALGAPSLGDWALRLRLEAALRPLARGLSLARSEAMATGRTVSFSPPDLPTGLRWPGAKPTVSFGPSGGATPATLTLCASGTRGRSLVVSRSGRIRAADAVCGFALLEVLAGLLLLAMACLAATQSHLSATRTAVAAAAYRQSLDASTGGTESLRAIRGDRKEWAARVGPAWVAGFAEVAPSVQLQALPRTFGEGWQVAAHSGALWVPLETSP